MSHCKDYANDSSITIIKYAAATQVSTPGHSGLNPGHSGFDPRLQPRGRAGWRTLTLTVYDFLKFKEKSAEVGDLSEMYLETIWGDKSLYSELDVFMATTS